MIQFNCRVQKDIDDRKFGQLGSPWELNLRDVFRWCQLVSQSYEINNPIDCRVLAEGIYLERLRCDEDRNELEILFRQSFGELLGAKRSFDFSMHPDHVKVGNAKVAKHDGIVFNPSGMILNAEEPILLRAHFRSLETIFHCVNMNWPCLIVGQGSSGKSTILKLAADLCNVKLEEVVLTPSSDVNELIGGFEQIDAAEVEKRLFLSLTQIIMYASTTLLHTKREISFLQKMKNLYSLC